MEIVIGIFILAVFTVVGMRIVFTHKEDMKDKEIELEKLKRCEGGKHEKNID